MSYFVQEFRDFVTCRGETQESLKKKFSISPSDGPKTHEVYFGRESVRYSRKDIMKALDHWRSAGKQYKEDQDTGINLYSINWEDLKKKALIKK